MTPLLLHTPRLKTVAAACLAACFAVITSPAATITVSDSWTVGTTIPDNNSSGLASVQSVTVDVSSIAMLTVWIEITDGWNGDYYAYLLHDTGFSVLLNRPGRATAKPAGSASSGMNLTIADAASQELHLVPDSGNLLGSWQPDGRADDPAVVLDTSPRTLLLAEFIGIDPNGTWTLFVADVAAGDQGTLQGWGITITGEQVPEPSFALCSAASLVLVLRRKRA